MKLHYSQTKLRGLFHGARVSVPYEITLLSNMTHRQKQALSVSVPYEITLLSNTTLATYFAQKVSVPYEITLLSNAYRLIRS